jgi:hypothetical protein
LRFARVSEELFSTATATATILVFDLLGNIATSDRFALQCIVREKTTLSVALEHTTVDSGIGSVRGVAPIAELQ